MPVGIAPAVTLRGGTVALWALTSNVPASLPATLHRAALGAEATASWHAAVLALPRSLPVLWRDLRELAQHPPVPVHLCSHLAEPGIERRDRVVDGGSFGLAFLLQLASRVLSLPLPPDVIASVAIDELGRTSRVDGLFEKLDGIATLAPRISRVLVAASQHDEVRSSAGRLQLVPVRTAAQALEVVFGDALGIRLAEAGSDDARRRELVDAFFRLALVGRGAAVDWSPVERGARIALRDWPPAFDDRYRLQFAAGVAARHERNAGEIAVPGPAWLDAQPAPIRVGVLTHLVQQSADTGTPSPDRDRAVRGDAGAQGPGRRVRAAAAARRRAGTAVGGHRPRRRRARHAAARGARVRRHLRGRAGLVPALRVVPAVGRARRRRGVRAGRDVPGEARGDRRADRVRRAVRPPRAGAGTGRAGAVRRRDARSPRRAVPRS